MNTVVINGVSREIASETEIHSVPELLRYIHQNFTSSSALLASVRLNGIEINIPGSAEEERRLEILEVGETDSIEVQTLHPREFAEETLQSLLGFTKHLEDFSRQASESAREPEFINDFDRLIDGLETFQQSIVYVKKILRVTYYPVIQVLETDFCSILQELSHFQGAGKTEYVAELLSKHLPENLQLWREKGIPELIRLRDS